MRISVVHSPVQICEGEIVGFLDSLSDLRVALRGDDPQHSGKFQLTCLYGFASLLTHTEILT